MDIFIRQLPDQANVKQVENFLREPLRAYGIQTFHVEKRVGKTHAKLSILGVQSSQRFLSDYGTPQTIRSAYSSPMPPARYMVWHGSPLQLRRDRYQPNEHAVRALEYEASRAAAESSRPSQSLLASSTAPRKFDIHGLRCGIWNYAGSQLAFTPYYEDVRPGTVTFGVHQAVVQLRAPGSDEYRLYLPYHNVADITLGTYQHPAITFKLSAGPKIYKMPDDDDLVGALSALNLGMNGVQREEKKRRIPSLGEVHAKVVGSCFVYQLSLRDFRRISEVRTLLNQSPRMPVTTSLSTTIKRPREQFELSMVRLEHHLTDQGLHGNLPFGLLWQICMLARNGLLHPHKVLALLPTVAEMYETRGFDTTLSALRRFVASVPLAGPDVEASSVTTEALNSLLSELANDAERYPYNPEDPYRLAERYAHIELVHKLVITPTGTYLKGPHPEPTNRVLRRYASHTDYFVRMVFQEEDGGSVRYDPRSIQPDIYARFKEVLNSGVIVAGRAFSFLGFSHSSLRAQSVWCMAPIFLNGSLQLPEHIIRALGDFSNIRVPAKCAARIGQNFTDTNATILLSDQDIPPHLPMVQRNGRDFGDGVGTISRDMLREVWQVYGTRRFLKPTVLQIRFQGYKGMVSLDERLNGKRLMLRENMKKFEAPSAWHLEICGAAFRSLPMILNRGLIKILEDLGVDGGVFMRMQHATVEELRRMTTSAINTAHMLEQADTTRATRVPYLIRTLAQIGLDYHHDPFLYRVVEMTVIAKLRDIKYRGRIPVKDGVTLYGIMDETGYLQEGEIYVTTEKAPQGGRWELIKDRALVTRSPVMHPGDVQLVNAVGVPSNSPLKKLHNVVVFSQHGARDLPSMLSGGDLDGDLYNVIWDPALTPPRTHPPADYPRVSAREMDRSVTRKDMAEFFVTFMQTDQLGMLSNIHLQLADQRPMGTLDPDCIRLAYLASISVDFSKTGISVDMNQVPKYQKIRPDFMAPGPRVLIEERGNVQFEEANTTDETIDNLDIELPPMRFYRSEKVLGYLYRAIDEEQFLQAMQHEHEGLLLAAVTGASLPERLLEYILHHAGQFGVEYAHHADLAFEIRDGYEDSLLDLLKQHGPFSHQPATEYEAFAGCILGRSGGAQGKPLRDLSKKVREQFESVCEYTTMRIVKGDEQMQAVFDLDVLNETEGLDRELEALPRAIACLKVGVEGEGKWDRKLGELQSFKYIAAGVCLREWERYRITTLGTTYLPRV